MNMFLMNAPGQGKKLVMQIDCFVCLPLMAKQKRLLDPIFINKL